MNSVKRLLQIYRVVLKVSDFSPHFWIKLSAKY